VTNPRDIGKYKIASPLEEFFKERAMKAEMTMRCHFCRKVFRGTAERVIELARQHRELKHPQAVDRGQKARQVAAKKKQPPPAPVIEDE